MQSAHIDGESDPAVGAVVGVHIDDQVGGRYALDPPILQVDAACSMPASLLVSISAADAVGYCCQVGQAALRRTEMGRLASILTAPGRRLCNLQNQDCLSGK